ncbi:MAG: gluconokinase [Ktedonobacterales bacterium]
MHAQSCTIGVDLGTTSAKAVAFDRDSHEIVSASQPIALINRHEGEAEQDAFAVATATNQALASAVRAACAAGYDVARVGLSAAMHSLLPLNAWGRPMANAMIWMDVRAAPQAEELWSTPEGKALYERTGTPIHAMSPLSKLLWLRQNQPEIFERAARFISLKEWVWHYWFNVWEVDTSIASATGLFNLREHTWDAEALRIAGISAEELSRLVPTTFRRTNVNERMLLEAGLSDETTFVIGASDGVLANLAAGVISNEQMVLTIGTSCAVRSGTTTPVTDPATRSFCYVLGDNHFIAGSPSNNGGIVLDWLYHKVLSSGILSTTAHAMDALVTEARDARDDDLLCLPYIAGERGPLWNAGASGVFLGLRLEHTGAHLMRAAIEGILFNSYWMASSLFAGLGRPARIIASGKVLNEEWIRQLAADIYSMPVAAIGEVDASTLGAALIANIGCGLLNWEEAARQQSALVHSVTQPSGNDGYQRKFERYRTLTGALTTQLADVYLPHGVRQG